MCGSVANHQKLSNCGDPKIMMGPGFPVQVFSLPTAVDDIGLSIPTPRL